MFCFPLMEYISYYSFKKKKEGHKNKGLIKNNKYLY